MPRNRLPDGPALVAANIASEEDISAELTLLDQQGSQVRQGNLLLVPVGESLLYVRPLYTQAAGPTAVPELKKVIVTFNGNSYMRDTLGEALQAAFGQAPPVAEPTAEPRVDRRADAAELGSVGLEPARAGRREVQRG